MGSYEIVVPQSEMDGSTKRANAHRAKRKRQRQSPEGERQQDGSYKFETNTARKYSKGHKQKSMKRN